MADEISTTIKTASDGTVTIAVEKYHELLKLAEEKPPVIQRTVVNRTPAVQARDHRDGGALLMGLGGSLLIIGAVKFTIGLRQLKALK